MKQSLTRLILVFPVLWACGNADRTQPTGDRAADPSARHSLRDTPDSTLIGVVGVRGDTTCLRAPRSIDVGRTIIIALPDADTLIQATTGAAMAYCPDEAPRPGQYYTAIDASLAPGMIGIAVLAAEPVPAPPHAVDVDRDGSLETFRICTSHEGLHLTVWSGEPLLGRRIWHYYYFLGYDVEPNCTPADYAEDPV